MKFDYLALCIFQLRSEGKVDSTFFAKMKRILCYCLLFLKDVQNLSPATDFYKKFALDCAAEQVAVDLFLLSGQYADIASLSKFYEGTKWPLTFEINGISLKLHQQLSFHRAVKKSVVVVFANFFRFIYLLIYFI